jgi:hypothetical protein
MIPMQRVVINGRYIRNVFGSSVAVPVWKGFMTRTLEGQAVPGFAPAGQDEVLGKQVPVPRVVGRDEGAARAALSAAGFGVSVGAPAPSDLAPGLVVSQSLSGTGTIGSTVGLVLSSGPAPPAAPPAAPPPAPPAP